MKHKQQITADDELIESEMRRLNTLAEQRGLNAAHTEVISRLIASVLWLDHRYGTQQSYELFQSMADNLIEYGRDACSHVG
jgi:hypothetical protein